MFLSGLYQKRLESVKNGFRIKEGKIDYLADDFYPGGQKVLEKIS
jgi:hypothetical protein